MNRRAEKPPGLTMEWAFAGLIVLSIAYTTWHLFTWKYLPPPFFYEPDDIYGDWFNTAFWARNPGSFDTWTTLYPPLSFVLLRFLGIDSCYIDGKAFETSPGLAARSCDWLGVTAIWGFWALSVVLVFLALRRIDRRTAIPRTICVGLGWPFLNAIERGNLVLIAFPCFVLATMPLLKSARLRWLFAAMSINLKVYLVAPFLVQLVRRRWRWVEGVLLATILVYCVSFAMLGRGTPIEIVTNLSAWSNIIITNPLDFWPATTYQALYSLMESDTVSFPILLMLGSRETHAVQVAITILLAFTQIMLVAAIAATYLRPESITRYRLFALGLLLALITSEAGGYTPAFFMLLVMTEKWEGAGVKFAIVACYVMAISFDWPVTGIAEVVRDSYFEDATVIAQMNVTVWPLLRPLVIQLIAIALACATIRQIWLDVQTDGWAQRWRYRRDVPLLPWVRAPVPPSAARPAAHG